jgi:hypothetical protein
MVGIKIGWYFNRIRIIIGYATASCDAAHTMYTVRNIGEVNRTQDAEYECYSHAWEDDSHGKS